MNHVQSGSPVVVARAVSKTFGSTRALDGVNLELLPGEAHGLIGANGSGKSTLIRILAGACQADAGSRLELRAHSQDLSTWDTAKARAAGMRFVHQDPCLFPSLSVAENLAADGRLASRWLSPIRWRRLYQDSRQLLERFGLDVDPRTQLDRLRPADRAMVAILRALRDVDTNLSDAVLVLDEPTASLPRREVDLLLESVGRLTRHGHAVLYVSHRLDEILAVTRRVSVIRDGHNVDTVRTSEVDEDRLVQMITGRPRAVAAHSAVPVAGRTPLLEVCDLSSTRLRRVSFQVRRGEILGVVGMLGSGRSELLKVLFGDRPRTSGEVVLDGEPVHFSSPAQAMQKGLAYVPEDRGIEAAFLSLDVDANLSAAVVRSYWSAGRLRHRRRKADSRRMIADFGIVTGSVDLPLRTLSGGNQQKVILARWLRRQPRVLLLDEPTQGVDVGARAEIYQLIRAAADSGAAVIAVLSDFEEMAQVVDRAVGLRDGKITGEISSKRLTAASLTDLLYRTPGEVA